MDDERFDEEVKEEEMEREPACGCPDAPYKDEITEWSTDHDIYPKDKHLCAVTLRQFNEDRKLSKLMKALFEPCVCSCPVNNRPTISDITSWASEGAYPFDAHSCPATQQFFEEHKAMFDRIGKNVMAAIEQEEEKKEK